MESLFSNILAVVVVVVGFVIRDEEEDIVEEQLEEVTLVFANICVVAVFGDICGSVVVVVVVLVDGLAADVPAKDDGDAAGDCIV